MGWGAGENGSGSLPWGAHREGVLLVTEMTFTESWPALQSSRALPHTHCHGPHSQTIPASASRAPGGCVLESGVSGWFFPGFSLHPVSPPRSPPLTPAHAHCPQSTRLSPPCVLSGHPAPAYLGNTGNTAQRPHCFPSRRQKPPHSSVSAWAWGKAITHPHPCSQALVGTLRTFVPRDAFWVSSSSPG